MRRTLSRYVEFRQIEAADIRFLWVSYKKGLLVSLGGVFVQDDMTADEFKIAITGELDSNYDAAWTLLAPSSRGFGPVGFVLGIWAHPNVGVFMHVGDLLWLPWASGRNKIESAVNFFDKMRREVPMVEYARMEHKKFFVTMCAHGIMRRIGTSYSIYPGDAAAVFETRGVS